jgi:8-oxo-dGTP pyrophosphatase MutT (NUDIX family)
MKNYFAYRILSHKYGESWKPGIRGYHNATGGIIMALDTGRINLQLRSPTSDTPSCYGCWGGSLDNNEEQIAGLKREIKEETGYCGPMQIYPLMTYLDSTKGFTYYNHLVIVPTEFEPTLNKESSGHKWMTLQEIPKNIHPGLKDLFKDKMSWRILTNASNGKFGDTYLKLNASSRLLVYFNE